MLGFKELILCFAVSGYVYLMLKKGELKMLLKIFLQWFVPIYFWKETVF